MLTLEAYLMGRDKDPRYSSEYNLDIEANALDLIDKVNALLKEIGVAEVKVTSGWRPAAINANLANSAKASSHMTGMAVDLADASKSIYGLIEAKPGVLKKFGLWMEHKDNTPNWTHLDTRQRSARDIQIFKA